MKVMYVREFQFQQTSTGELQFIVLASNTLFAK